MTLDDGSSYIDETDEYLGMRWSSVTIGAGAEIDVADVDVWFLSPNYDEPDHAVWFEDSGSPGQFAADDNDISSRTPTTATTMLSDANLGVVPGGNWLSELVYGKQDVKSIVEELVASYDYSGGAPMVCIMQGSANAARDLSIGTYDFSGNVWGGKLHIEFTPAAPAGQPTQVRTQGVPTGSGARDRIGRWN